MQSSAVDQLLSGKRASKVFEMGRASFDGGKSWKPYSSTGGSIPVGTTVVIDSHTSGVDSSMIGTIIDPKEVKTDGQGVPEIEGHYSPVDWKRQYALRLKDGRIITMFKNRVSPLEATHLMDPYVRARNKLDTAAKTEAVDPVIADYEARGLMGRPVRIHLDDGTNYMTTVNGDDESIKRYFVGAQFNQGDTDAHPADKMVTVTKVDFLDGEAQHEAEEAKQLVDALIAGDKGTAPITSESDEAGEKKYRTGGNIGRAKNVVSFHDGVKKHADGSPFFDVKICGNKRKADAFVRGLKKQGYSEAVNEDGEGRPSTRGDPTHDEMMAVLAKDANMWGEDWEDEAEIAIYYFAMDYHGGQSSNLYSAGSTSVYTPGPTSELSHEGEIVQMMYTELEDTFFPGVREYNAKMDGKSSEDDEPYQEKLGPHPQIGEAGKSLIAALIAGDKAPSGPVDSGAKEGRESPQGLPNTEAGAGGPSAQNEAGYYEPHKIADYGMLRAQVKAKKKLTPDDSSAGKPKGDGKSKTSDAKPLAKAAIIADEAIAVGSHRDPRTLARLRSVGRAAPQPAQQDLSTMDRAQLGALYVNLIGYNPFEDDPTMTDDEVRKILGEYREAGYGKPGNTNESLIQEMQYSISPDGTKLTITAGPEEMERLTDANDIYDALEPLVANSELDWVRAEDVGALTDAPLLGVRQPGTDGEAGAVDGAWGYMDYQIKDPLEELRTTGKLVFTGSGPSGDSGRGINLAPRTESAVDRLISGQKASAVFEGPDFGNDPAASLPLDDGTPLPTPKLDLEPEDGGHNVEINTRDEDETDSINRRIGEAISESDDQAILQFLAQNQDLDAEAFETAFEEAFEDESLNGLLLNRGDLLAQYPDFKAKLDAYWDATAQGEEFEEEEQEDGSYEEMKSDIASGECYVLQDGRGGLIDVYGPGRKNLGSFTETAEALAAVDAHMKKSQFFPSIYSINDHGNVDAIDVTGKIYNSWV